MHGARTADDKVAPALLGTHSNWHGLEGRGRKGQRDNDLHGFGRAGIDGPSDGACMLQVCRTARALASRRLGLAASRASRKLHAAIRCCRWQNYKTGSPAQRRFVT